MASFADRLLVHLSDPANLPGFLAGTDLAAFLTADFQRRLDSEFWRVAQIALAQGTMIGFERPLWTRTRILGRQEQHGNAQARRTVDYSVYGTERATWVDAEVELDTTWSVDQFPGTVEVSEANPATFEGVTDVPDGEAGDYRFGFAMPVRTDRQTLRLVTRLHLFVPAALDLVDDLRGVLAARQVLEQGEDFLRSLDDLAGKVPHSFGLVYEAGVLDGSGLDAAGVSRLGAGAGVLVLFFALP